MSSIKGIRQRLENLFAGVAEAIPASGPADRAALPRETSRPRGWVWELDLDGVYTWSSPEIERILGFPSEEVVGKKFPEVGFNADAAETIQSRLSAGGQIQQLIVDALHKDGRSFKVLIRAMHRIDATGAALGYRGVSQLVEPDKVGDRLVVEMPTPPEQIGATTPAPLAAGWGTILGYEDDGESVHPVQEVEDAHPGLSEDQAKLLVIPLQVQDEIIGVIELEGAEGQSPWREEDRALANAIAHELAITLQDARSYQLTQQALEEMREADRLKSQFLANMSHELRTPLNSIIGFSRVILKGIDGPITETQEQDLNAIYNAGQHLLGLINNILDISKIEAGKMELAFTDVDLSEIIRGVMATAVGLVKDKPIELITDIPEQLPVVQADNIRIRQVLLNLVSNAAKFTEEGHIGVSARTIQRAERNEVVIAVFDTGPGIDQEDQERIFEPFSQVDASPTRKTGGTGLGLSISKHLVELHGGVIWVESIPDEGSTFAFTLPFDPEFQTTRSLTSLILGIDHDPGPLMQYRQSFESAGFRFHALSRPEQTLEVAKALQPQAILLDLLGSNEKHWELLKSLAEDPVFRTIPTLITEYEEATGEGVLLPIQHWLTPDSRHEDVIALIERIYADPGEELSLILIDDQQTYWSELFSTIELPGQINLQAVHSTDQLNEITKEIQPDGLFIHLGATTELVMEALQHCSENMDRIGVGLLAAKSGSKPFTAQWQQGMKKTRLEHLKYLVDYLNAHVQS